MHSVLIYKVEPEDAADDVPTRLALKVGELLRTLTGGVHEREMPSLYRADVLAFRHGPACWATQRRQLEG